MMKLPSDYDIAQVNKILGRTATTPDLLLPTLLDVQRRLGHVPNSVITVIAQHFNLSRADVHGVVTFYHDLRTATSGRRRVQICQAEACQAQGCRALTTHAEQRLGIKIGTTRTDASVTLEGAYCFGNCACGPTVRIGDRVYGRVTGERFDELIDLPDDAESRL
jgi:formate dehydrogenase subunit gamma